MSFHRVLEGLQAVGELLIKRGSAMGPLVPSIIVLVPGFIVAAWFFRSTAMIKGVPLISALFVIAALGIVIDYHRRYAFFCKERSRQVAVGGIPIQNGADADDRS